MAKTKKSFPCSSMKVGDAYNYRVNTTDRFQKFELAKVKIDPSYEVWWNERLQLLDSENKLHGFVWVPQLIDPSYGESEKISVTKTGGRTYRIDDKKIKKIKINLADFGWSDEPIMQEMMYEIKGGGTLISDAGVTLKKLKRAAKEVSEKKLEELVKNLMKGDSDYLCITSKSDRGRPKGSQLARYSDHSKNVTIMLYQNFPVKFAPLLSVSSLPDSVKNQINIVNRTLKSKEERVHCTDYTQEIRLNPSDVRAIYFDKANTDEDLIKLCSRVSKKVSVLDNASEAMLADSRRYLEVLAKHTMSNYGSYLWAKLGDIHLSWAKDGEVEWDDKEANEYKTDKPFAWYLAKDITVAGTGFWFVDLESLRAGPVHQLCDDKSDLDRKQEHYVICVLRDFQRVITKFEIGKQLLKGKEVPHQKRKGIQEHIIRRMLKEINKSEHISLKRRKGKLHLKINYARIPGESLSLKIPEEYIMRRY